MNRSRAIVIACSLAAVAALVALGQAGNARPAAGGGGKGEKAERSRFVTPVVKGYGAVVPMPGAEEPPKKGARAAFDVTATNKDATKPLPGLERAAVLLNLAGAAGLKPGDVEVAVVLHGDATSAALDDGAYRKLTGTGHPHAELMKRLKQAGVKILVCGQSLERKGLDVRKVRDEVKVAASAVSAVINLQSRGYAYVPAH